MITTATDIPPCVWCRPCPLSVSRPCRRGYATRVRWAT